VTGLPLLLDLAGRLAVVVGGGPVGLRRARTLHEADARVRVIAPAPVPELTGLQVEVQRRPYRPGDLAGAWFAVAATGDAAVNAAVAAEAEAARIFCIRADQAAGGTARMPAVARRGPITVAVNAGDPARAVELRNLLAAVLDTQAVLPPPTRAGAGSVALVGGGPGDPELITVRGRRLLFEADVVVADRLAPRALLADLAAGTEVIDCGKSAHRHNLSQDEINEVIVRRALAGQRVVRLKGGDPFVFGRGGEEVAACLAAGVPVQVVPGITSSVAAPAAAGIPVTHRGLSADFAVVSGHRDPGVPGGAQPESGWNWAELAVGPGTLVLLMAMGRLAEISAELIRHGRAADTPAAVVQNATLPEQRVLRAPLAGLAAAAEAGGFTAPAVVVIGAVAALGA